MLYGFAWLLMLFDRHLNDTSSKLNPISEPPPLVSPLLLLVILLVILLLLALHPSISGSSPDLGTRLLGMNY